MAKSRFTSAWGCGRGALKRFSPAARLYCGALALCACLVCDASTFAGAAFCAFTAAFTLALARPPVKALLGASLFGALLLAPFFLFAPFVEDGLGPAVCAAIFIKGFCSVMVSFAAVSSLSAGDFHDALAASFLPAPAAVITAQIERRTACALDDAECVAKAIALRSGKAGARAAIAAAANAPAAWLRRTLINAESAAMAMEMRGYGERLPRFSDRKTNAKDAAMTALFALLLAAAAAVRIRGAR